MRYKSQNQTGIQQDRIRILDSFRAFAIVSVMLYHFFSRWIAASDQPSLYPYNDQYNYFSFGNYGVQFFFIISGFVITKTLESTHSIYNFWVRRLIRLFPAMLIASFIILSVFLIFDRSLIFPQAHQFKNILPGISFINPGIYNYILQPEVKYSYLNGSFWSLWPEIQFYFLASCLYYFNRKHFIRNFFIISIPIILIDRILEHISSYQTTYYPGTETIITQLYYYWIYEIMNLPNYLVYFSLGVVFFILHKNRLNNNKSSFSVKAVLIFLCGQLLYFTPKWQAKALVCIMVLLFICFIYYPERLSWLTNNITVKTGIASYFIYLIHEYIGVLIIHSFASFFPSMHIIVPLALIILFILIGIIYTDSIDKKITFLLKRRMKV